MRPHSNRLHAADAHAPRRGQPADHGRRRRQGRHARASPSAEALRRAAGGGGARAARHRPSHAKGPVFDTAIIAGVMAAKRTARADSRSAIRCRSSTAASISHRRARPAAHQAARVRGAAQDRRRDGSADRRQRRGADHLRHVQGAVARHPHRDGATAGKVRRQARRQRGSAPVARAVRMSAPLYGLVLAGGRSTRMQRDKAGARIRTAQRSCARRGTARAAGRARLRVRARRPAARSAARGFAADRRSAAPTWARSAGIHAALRAHPQAAWLVLACDLPSSTRRRSST